MRPPLPDTARISIVGGSGYIGGELLRLLLFHPHVEVQQVTSRSRLKKPVVQAHPNLRGVTDIRFSDPEQLEPCDILFLALPHGEAAQNLDTFVGKAGRIIDCSADFRLNSADSYRLWYGEYHPRPEWLREFVYGLPELNREEIVGAKYVSGVGCNAAVTNLSLAPLAQAGILDTVVADIKVGSSEGGARAAAASHHPERSGSVRSFKLTGHRHQAEIKQQLGDSFTLHFSVTAIELIRGTLVTAHCLLNSKVSDKDIWALYRKAYGDEPFIRLVKKKTGLFRYPDPKLLGGTNYCDIGFEVDPAADGPRLVVVGALDNLMKGSAGSAVQCMNLMMNWPETAGLTFPGLHPA